MLIGASGVDGDSSNSTLPRPRVWLAASVVPPSGVLTLSAPLIVWPLLLTALSSILGPNDEFPAKMYARLTVLSVTLSKVTLLLAAVISNEKPAIVVEAPVLVRVTSRL